MRCSKCDDIMPHHDSWTCVTCRNMSCLKGIAHDLGKKFDQPTSTATWERDHNTVASPMALWYESVFDVMYPGWRSGPHYGEHLWVNGTGVPGSRILYNTVKCIKDLEFAEETKLLEFTKSGTNHITPVCEQWDTLAKMRMVDATNGAHKGKMRVGDYALECQYDAIKLNLAGKSYEEKETILRDCVRLSRKNEQ